MVNRPTADRAEMKRHLGTRIADANEGCRSASHGYAGCMEARLHAEHAASSALTFKTMADRNAHRLADGVNA